MTRSHSENAPAVSQSVVTVVDNMRLDAIAEMAGSYWHSIGEAVRRGERLTLGVHLRQARAVTIEALNTFNELGSEGDGKAEAA